MGGVDAFTLQIHRYSQALIDLAGADPPLIRYCVAGRGAHGINRCAGARCNG